MAEIPRCFVADSESPLDLIRAHAFACFAEQQRCQKPLLQREVGVVEDRSGGDCELIVAILAIEKLLRGCQFYGWHLTAWTFNTSRPAEPDKNLTAFFVSIKQIYNVN
jgi:hypothetical protein